LAPTSRSRGSSGIAATLSESSWLRQLRVNTGVPAPARPRGFPALRTASAAGSRRAPDCYSLPGMAFGPRCLLVLTGAAIFSSGCERQRVSDPGAVVAAYADAARRGDADAIYALLSRRAQTDLGRAGTRQKVLDARRELALQADFFARPGVEPEVVAVVRYDDGEQAELGLESGVFLVGSASALPAAARTPAEALAGLRQALARRSYVALVRVLSAETRGALESDVGSIVESLEDPETLDVQVSGDDAEVELPSGHSVRLKREAGVWRVEDLK